MTDVPNLLGSTDTFTGSTTFTQTINGSITGNAGTVTNGVYTTGSYMNPSWITALAGTKITGTVASATTAGTATTALTAVSATTAGTAAALSATPAQCSASQFATGIAASGNANCAQPASTSLSDSSSLVRQTPILFNSGGLKVGSGTFVGVGATNSTEGNVQQIVAEAGHMVGMQCFTQAASTTNTTFTVRHNGASTTAVCTINAGSTKGSAVVSPSIAFAAGDLFDILVQGSGAIKPVSIAVATTP